MIKMLHCDNIIARI